VGWSSPPLRRAGTQPPSPPRASSSPGAEGAEEPEGKAFKYTCAECKEKTFRSTFLIEARNARGELDPGHDFQGSLYGRCYECVRGRGPNEMSEDLYANWASNHAEKKILSLHKRECKALHNRREDIQRRDVKRLREANFSDLMAQLSEEFVDLPRHKRYKYVVSFVKGVIDDITVGFLSGNREAQAKLLAVMQRYEDNKEMAATRGDSEGIPVPGSSPPLPLGVAAPVGAAPLPLGVGSSGASDGPKPMWKGLGQEYQWCSKLSDHCHRYFLCRNKNCTPRGSYFSKNIYWISTVEAGGWQFMCPKCGEWFQPGRKGENTIPAHFAIYLETTNQLVLSEWPCSAEETAVADFMALMTEADLGPYEELSTEELRLSLSLMVKQNTAGAHMMEDMELTPYIENYVKQQNASRTRKKPWSINAVKDGFQGAFYKYTETSPILTTEDTKKFLAGVKVMLRRQVEAAAKL